MAYRVRCYKVQGSLRGTVVLDTDAEKERTQNLRSDVNLESSTVSTKSLIIQSGQDNWCESRELERIRGKGREHTKEESQGLGFRSGV